MRPGRTRLGIRYTREFKGSLGEWVLSPAGRRRGEEHFCDIIMCAARPEFDLLRDFGACAVGTRPLHRLDLALMIILKKILDGQAPQIFRDDAAVQCCCDNSCSKMHDR